MEWNISLSIIALSPLPPNHGRMVVMALETKLVLPLAPFLPGLRSECIVVEEESRGNILLLFGCGALLSLPQLLARMFRN